METPDEKYNRLLKEKQLKEEIKRKEELTEKNFQSIYSVDFKSPGGLKEKLIKLIIDDLSKWGYGYSADVDIVTMLPECDYFVRISKLTSNINSKIIIPGIVQMRICKHDCGDDYKHLLINLRGYILNNIEV
jgi:hypothetical protein